MAKRRCLVTGGAGFIGSHLVEALVNQGEFVTVLDNLDTGDMDNLAHLRDKIRFVKGDIRDMATVKKACQKQDIVFHYAALASIYRSFQEPEANFNINVAGTFNVLEASHLAGVPHVVVVSSSSVYQDLDEGSQDEESPIRPLSPYAHSKWTAEQVCQMYENCFGLTITTFRYFNVIGTRQDPKSPYSGVLSIFADRVARGQTCTIYGDGLQSRDFVHVKDVVKANLLAMEARQGGVYNIGSGQSHSLLELVSALENAHGQPIHVEHAPGRPGEARQTLANIFKAQVELGYYPEIHFQQGIEEILNAAKERINNCKTFRVIWDAATKSVKTEV